MILGEPNKDMYRRKNEEQGAPSNLVNLASVLQDWEVHVVEERDWRTRGNLPFTPEGIIVHHTGGNRIGDAPSLHVVRDTGRPRDDIPPPLCNILLARSGVAHIIAALKVNHAGLGNSQVLEQVRQDVPPIEDVTVLHLSDDMSGNQWFYGIEVQNTGLFDDPYPPVQIEALVRCCAALCSSYGWTSARVIHHREWTSRKSDMSYRGPLRLQVLKQIAAGP
ncbi:MAG: N-acetylmuramoyl-L-alanine amidase [Rubrobacter sp.]|nr:N-acetylmuramoyl-L-alanine amidase [Rubrobacter sp.]